MSNSTVQALSTPQERALEAARQVALVVGASLFVALCARVTIPLPFTPVPLTVQNFAVLLVGLLLGSRRGGYLMVYPLVAALAGFVYERGTKTFARAAVAGLLGEILLFVGGLTWLYVIFHSLKTAAYFGLYWFVAAEVMKVMFAAAIAVRWRRSAKA
jgi:biotin transport system substrate-specific component